MAVTGQGPNPRYIDYRLGKDLSTVMAVGLANGRPLSRLFGTTRGLSAQQLCKRLCRWRSSRSPTSQPGQLCRFITCDYEASNTPKEIQYLLNWNI